MLTRKGIGRAGLFAVAALAAAGCKTPTEVVVRLETAGASTTPIDVRLHRSVPFNGTPPAPAFVLPFLDGADLILEVTPQSAETTMSLLPPKAGPNDLQVSVSAAGYSVDPASPQDGSFVEHVSKELRFTLSALPPDLGAPDRAVRRDLAPPPMDDDAAAPPDDLASDM